MPIFALNEEIKFPAVELAEENGILAIGGDLSPERLIEAYSNGIFPWYSQDDPIIWWTPDPRFVLFPGEVKLSRTTKQVVRRKIFEITYDKSFITVITECQKPRKSEQSTWITGEMLDAYIKLHNSGLAHSVEAWKDGKIAGGLYGISLGRCFFGESMFTLESNASKAAFVTLVSKLQELNFLIIDCQVYTDHLKQFGARQIPRSDFIKHIKKGLQHKTLIGNWGNMTQFAA